MHGKHHVNKAPVTLIVKSVRLQSNSDNLTLIHPDAQCMIDFSGICITVFKISWTLTRLVEEISSFTHRVYLSATLWLSVLLHQTFHHCAKPAVASLSLLIL